jgi:hypothetical protein
MDHCNGISILIEPNIWLYTSNDTYIALENNILEYQQALGSLIYIMLEMRPDLIYSISTLSKFNINPSYEHVTAIQYIFQYL